MNNIVTCSRCLAPLISEELDIHECFTKILVDMRYDTDTDEYFFYDGKKWYRWFPPTDSQQRNKTTDKSTEPTFFVFYSIFCKYYDIIGFYRWKSRLIKRSS